jgi:hypothetical protein
LKVTKYAKVGDTVKIVTPMTFIRCGYPLSVKILKETRKAHINTLAYKAASASGLNYHNGYVKNALTHAIVFDMLRKENFGGRVKIIEEKEEPRYSGKFGKVVKRRFVYTGRYSPGWGGNDYWTGEFSGEYPSLEEKKIHCVYDLWVESVWGNTVSFLDKNVDRFDWKIKDTLEELDTFEAHRKEVAA